MTYKAIIIVTYKPKIVVTIQTKQVVVQLISLHLKCMEVSRHEVSVMKSGVLRLESHGFACTKTNKLPPHKYSWCSR